jgi:hypothetical protein
MYSLCTDRWLLIPAELYLYSASARYVYQLYHDQKLTDKYPARLKDTVELIKSSINTEMYKKLTSSEPNPVSLYDNFLHVQPISDAPDWVVIGSGQREFFGDLKQFSRDGTRAVNHFSNVEGGVFHNDTSLLGQVLRTKKFRQIIKKFNLEMIKVPKKYYCSYPSQISGPSMFFNPRRFILTPKCDVNLSGAQSMQNFIAMNEAERTQMSKELCIFLEHSGVVDLRFNKFYIKDKQFVLFGTEPMSLDLKGRISILEYQEPLVNYMNLKRVFYNFPEGRTMMETSDLAIRLMRGKETLNLRNYFFVAFLVCLVVYTLKRVFS